ncbi:MAG TPA: EndoU domain-containing protein [Streptosporangiaceae bacterium]|nr:EndoU domain-containing protein [Streptosporangiaceae bacterium]
MAQDGPYDGENRDARPERRLQAGRLDSDAAGAQAELAEPRTRAEYYETLRATTGETARADEDPRTARSGWDEIDAANRPDIDALRVTPERATHILDGDKTGGGHRHGTGKPGKTEFPASWDDRKVIDSILDVGRRPDSTPGHQEWNDRWVVRGARDDVGIVAVIERDGRIWTAWPLPGGTGVVKNPEGT